MNKHADENERAVLMIITMNKYLICSSQSSLSCSRGNKLMLLLFQMGMIFSLPLVITKLFLIIDIFSRDRLSLTSPIGFCTAKMKLKVGQV